MSDKGVFSRLELHKNNFLKANPITIDTNVQLDLVKRHIQIVDANPAHFTGTATKMAHMYVVEGDVTGELTLDCARCLTPFPYHYQVMVKETFVDTEGGPIEQGGETDYYPLIEDKIQLNPSLQSAILLSLPQAIRCSDQCQGICPECGINRNEKKCGCVVKKVDPRWAALEELFNNKE